MQEFASLKTDMFYKSDLWALLTHRMQIVPVCVSLHTCSCMGYMYGVSFDYLSVNIMCVC